jgi:hypothetical protein
MKCLDLPSTLMFQQTYVGKAATPKTESVARCDSVGLRTPNLVPVQGIMFRRDEAEMRHSLRHVALHISAGASGRSVGGETRAVETRTAVEDDSLLGYCAL